MNQRLDERLAQLLRKAAGAEDIEVRSVIRRLWIAVPSGAPLPVLLAGSLEQVLVELEVLVQYEPARRRERLARAAKDVDALVSALSLLRVKADGIAGRKRP